MKRIVVRLAALKPRNPLARLARTRHGAGAHAKRKHDRRATDEDFVQRLREAGL